MTKGEAPAPAPAGLNDTGIFARFSEPAASRVEPIRDLISLEKIKGKTVIRAPQRMLLAQLHFISDKFYKKDKTTGLTTIEAYLRNYLEYGISVDGKSREQFVDVHKTMGAQQSADSLEAMQAQASMRR